MKLDFKTTVDVIMRSDSVVYEGKAKLLYSVEIETAQWGIHKMEVVPDMSSLKDVILFDHEDNEKIFDLSNFKYNISGIGTTPVSITIGNKELSINVEEVL
jgi:hypothetical protein